MPAASLYSGASWYVGRKLRDDFGAARARSGRCQQGLALSMQTTFWFRTVQRFRRAMRTRCTDLGIERARRMHVDRGGARSVNGLDLPQALGTVQLDPLLRSTRIAHSWYASDVRTWTRRRTTLSGLAV